MLYTPTFPCTSTIFATSTSIGLEVEPLQELPHEEEEEENTDLPPAI